MSTRKIYYLIPCGMVDDLEKYCIENEINLEFIATEEYDSDEIDYIESFTGLNDEYTGENLYMGPDTLVALSIGKEELYSILRTFKVPVEKSIYEDEE